MKSRNSLVLLSAAAIIAAPGGAFAQDAGGQPAAAAEDTGEIIVTAQRRAQALSDVGMSISAIGAETLSNRNITQAEDLSKLVTGFSVSDSGYASPIYTLRGVGINEPSVGSSSSVAVYVDEVPLSFPVVTQGASIDLQRIEVLKGPQGTLYGLNSTGGAVNYIANKPTDELSAGVTGTFGRFNRGSLEGYVSGPIAPTLKARIAGRWVFGDGWQRSITRNDDLGKVKNFTGRAIVEWEPAETVHLTFNANGWIDKSDTVAPQLVTPSIAVAGNGAPQVLNAPIPPANARDTDWDAGLNFNRDDKFWQTSLRAVVDISDSVSLTSITAYSKLNRDQFSDQDGIDGAVLRNRQFAHIKSFSQEVRLAADFGNLHWLVGANYSNDKTDEVVRQELPLSSQVRGRSTGGAILASQKISDWAVFTNLEANLTDQLSITGGIRMSQDLRKFAGCGSTLDDFSGAFYAGIVNNFRNAAGLTPYAPLAAGSCYSFYTTAAVQAQDTEGLPLYTLGLGHRKLKETNAPWNLNVNFKPTRDSLIYARVSRGYKSGNFATLNTTDLVAYNPIVQEKLTAYELGGRMALGRAFHFEAAVFRYDYINKQLRARINVGPPFGNINAQDNIPKSRLKGAEATAVVSPIKDLTLSVSGTYIKSKILQYTGYTINSVPNVNFAGTPFNFTPKWSVNADLNYSHPITDNLSGFFGVNYSYRSKTSAIFTPPSFTALSVYDIKSYSLVDGQLGVEGPDGKWKAWIWGKNIFNKYYWTNVLKVSDVTVKYPGMPRTFGGAVSYKF